MNLEQDREILAELKRECFWNALPEIKSRAYVVTDRGVTISAHKSMSAAQRAMRKLYKNNPTFWTATVQIVNHY